MQNCVRSLHRRKNPALLLKMDIAKAFDSVSWEYLLELLQAMGFSPRWRDWIATLLASSSSVVLLNGIPSSKIQHGKGLRQGDPLSPLLFILAFDPLHRAIAKASELGILKEQPGREIKMRMSLYADDTIVFANPCREEIDTLLKIFKLFGNATGLKMNPGKSYAVPIRCDNMDLIIVLQNFGGQTTSFPITYLGLPVTLTRPRMVQL